MSIPNVLLIVDMLTAWDYEGADEVADGAEDVVAAINRMRGHRSDELGVAYANDLDDGFHGSREKAFSLGMAGRRPDLVEPLEPDPAEEFIHKGQHSAFYGTPLAHYLDVNDVERIILAGQVTEQCILYTALDGHVRGYDMVVLTDAVLARKEHLGAAALEMIETNMSGELRTTGEVLGELAGTSG